MHTYRVHPDISVLADYLEVPGIGFLPVNAFVVHAAQPVVVDSGLGLPNRDFAAALAAVIDPADMIPAPANVVTTRARGAASRRANSPPVWSRSGC